MLQEINESKYENKMGAWYGFSHSPLQGIYFQCTLDAGYCDIVRVREREIEYM